MIVNSKRNFVVFLTDSSANQVAQVGSKYGGSVQIFCVDFGYEKGLLTETHQFRVVQRDICVSKKYSGNWILIRKQRSIWAEGDDGPDVRTIFD
ncbi:hypothetical protein R5R35_008644 [Gryllus longicercus]|uniref:Uncharacterized protein n=1 Tax=Gryllus longicercus TaxID=2509291 RepID=A0AAN9V6K8_9ORTH